MSVRNIMAATSGVLLKLNTKYWILEPSGNGGVSGFYKIPGNATTGVKDKFVFATLDKSNNNTINVNTIDSSGFVVESRKITEVSGAAQFRTFGYDADYGYALGTYSVQAGASYRFGIVRYTTTHALVFEKIHGVATAGKDVTSVQTIVIGDDTMTVGYDNYATTIQRGFFHLWNYAGSITTYRYVATGAAPAYGGGTYYLASVSNYLIATNGIISYYNSAFTLLGSVVATNAYSIETTITLDAVNNVLVVCNSSDLTVLHPTTRAIVWSRSFLSSSGQYAPYSTTVAVGGTGTDVRYYMLLTLPGKVTTEFVVICVDPTSKLIEWGRKFTVSGIGSGADYFNTNNSSMLVVDDSIYIKTNYYNNLVPIILKYPTNGALMGTFDKWIISDQPLGTNYQFIDNPKTAQTASSTTITANRLAVTISYTNNTDTNPTTVKTNVG